MNVNRARMTSLWRSAALRWIACVPLLLFGALAGCSPARRVGPAFIPNERLGPLTIAVAPALNLSGAADFDPSRFADLMASELSYADGISVIPVSRVLGVLAAQDLDNVGSQAHARELIKLLGADAILVFAVTEYDPYDPPSIAISAQLYGTRSVAGGETFDPVALSRQASLASSGSSSEPRRFAVQAQRVFNASHGSVVEEIKEFAAKRGGGESPYGWRRYLVSQQDFIRFCCYETICVLLNGRDDAVLADTTR